MRSPFQALKRFRASARSQAGFSNLELMLLVVIICILGVLVAVNFSAVQQKSRDTQRKNDLLALQDQINTYQAENDKYPTAAQLNNSTFVKANFTGFEAKILADPSWNSNNTHCTVKRTAQLEATTAPDKGCYGYAASPADCDNQNVDCTSYTLTANLESGGTYLKKSLD